MMYAMALAPLSHPSCLHIRDWASITFTCRFCIDCSFFFLYLKDCYSCHLIAGQNTHIDTPGAPIHNISPQVQQLSVLYLMLSQSLWEKPGLQVFLESSEAIGVLDPRSRGRVFSTTENYVALISLVQHLTEKTQSLSILSDLVEQADTFSERQSYTWLYIIQSFNQHLELHLRIYCKSEQQWCDMDKLCNLLYCPRTNGNFQMIFKGSFV